MTEATEPCPATYDVGGRIIVCQYTQGHFGAHHAEWSDEGAPGAPFYTLSWDTPP